MPTPPTTLQVNPAVSTAYTKRDLSTAPEAFKASLEIMFCHMGDMFGVVLDVLEEKYGHSKEEMLATLVAHPSYQSLPRHPVLDSLGYFGAEDLPAAAAAAIEVSEMSAVAVPAAATVPAVANVLVEAAPPKKVVVRRRKLKGVVE